MHSHGPAAPYHAITYTDVTPMITRSQYQSGVFEFVMRRNIADVRL